MSNALAALYGTFFTLQGGLAKRFQDRKDRGATAVEYGLLVGLIAVAIIATLVAIGPKLTGLFEQVSDGLDSVPAAG